MSSKTIRCAYCGQMTKEEHCGFYNGKTVHNMINCNCLEQARKIVSVDDFSRKKWFA